MTRNSQDPDALPMPDGWQTDNALMARLLREWGGTPDEVFDSPSDLADLIASVRADMHLRPSAHATTMFGAAAGGGGDGATVPAPPAPPAAGGAGVSTLAPPAAAQADAAPAPLCSLPVLAVAGVRDHSINVATLGRWSEVTDGRFASQTFPGEHFYLFEDAATTPRSDANFMAAVRAFVATNLEEQRAEVKSVVGAWNAASMEYPANKCLHDMFDDAVRAWPDAVACVDGATGASLTLTELNEAVTLLARRLVELGVGVDVPVGILMERSNE